MREKVYKHGPWVYRYMCRSCGHTVTHPQHQHPCTCCGGDFGHKTSMRKIWLEPVSESESDHEPKSVPKTRFEKFLAILGIEPPSPTPRQKSKTKQAKWRWQFHSEVEDDSGVIRHEEFFR